MADIIQFPLNDEKNWKGIEQKIREYLSQNCASDDMIEYVCEKLKKVNFSHSKSFQVNLTAPAGEDVSRAINDAVSQVVSNYKKIVSGMLFELMLREVEIYNLNKNQEI